MLLTKTCIKAKPANDPEEQGTFLSHVDHLIVSTPEAHASLFDWA